jgi:hypothetical protein
MRSVRGRARKMASGAGQGSGLYAASMPQIPDGTAATPKTFGSCQTGNAMAEHSISRLAP